MKKEIKNVETNEEVDKVKKDFHPLWIYLLFQIVVSVILMFVMIIVETAIVGHEVENKEDILNIVTLISNFGLFFVFFIMYFSKIKTETKKLTKKNVKFIILTGITMYVINMIITNILTQNNVAMTNQDSIANLVSAYTIPSFIMAGILMPFVEEVVFRYSLGSLIKNNVVFIIVSSILFGVIHGIGVATLLYILLGVIFALVYLKTERNFMASFFVHMINNLIGIILMIILLLIG